MKKLLGSAVRFMGRQNYLIIFLLLFVVLLVNSQTSIIGHSNENEKLYSSNPTQEIKVDEKADKSPKPTTKSKLSNKQTPQPNLDPIISCKLQEECGGQTIQIKKSECDKNICCFIGGDQWETLSQEDCTTKQNKYDDEQQQKYEDELKTYNDSWEKYLQDLQKSNEEYEAQKDELNDEYLLQQEAYLEYQNTTCKQDALNEYLESKSQITQIYASNNTIDSSAYEWEIDRLDSDYQAILDNCDYQYPVN